MTFFKVERGKLEDMTQIGLLYIYICIYIHTHTYIYIIYIIPDMEVSQGNSLCSYQNTLIK
jgi:hypothetical protein